MDRIEEKKLIEQARKTPEAFGKIFDAYHDTIFGYVLRRVGNIHAAQDITAETFFKAITRLSTFRWRGISISSWLYRIATNEINQYYRREKRASHSLNDLMDETSFDITAEVNLLEEIIEQEKELARAKEWQKMREELENLPSKYQTVITLRYFEDKKVAEIAEIIGKKEGTVKSLLSRGISKLKQKRLRLSLSKRNQNDGQAL